MRKILILLTIGMIISAYLILNDINKKVIELESNSHNLVSDIAVISSELTKIEERVDQSIQSNNELIRYLNDPRNLLKADSKMAISRGNTRRVMTDFSNVNNVSNVSVEGLNNEFEGTSMENLAEYFVQAEKTYGINAIFLSALAINESGWGNSRLAREKNNLFGFQAYNSDPFNNAKTFESKGESVMHVADYLVTHYLNPEGKYYNGTSIESINQRYAVLDDGTPNKKWGSNIKSIMKRLSN